jgi:hypothetical protein
MSALPAIQWGLIAGIKDHGGGCRVVFTDDPMSIPANTMFGKGERYFVSNAGWQPMTDIWNHKEWIIWKGEQAVLDADPERQPCGSCRACCITPFVADEGDGFTKPSHKPCHNLCNAGCSINASKPAVCGRFECMWLQSQSGNRPMSPELRPDRCGVMLTHEEDTTKIHIDRSYSKSAAMQAFVAARESEGERFDTVTHYFGESR